MLCWAVDDGPVFTGYPEELAEYLRTPEVTVIAHGSAFEREVLHRDSGNKALTIAVRKLSLHNWRCSSAKAGSASMPLALGQLGPALGIPAEVDKIKDGKRLINMFCVPQKVTRNQPLSRFTAETHPDEWQRFNEYCINDVEAMRWCWNLLPGRNYEDNLFEMKLWRADQEINKRGIPVDLESVNAIVVKLSDEVIRVEDKVTELTGGEITTANQRDRIIRWCGERGVNLPDLSAFTVNQALSDSRINGRPEVKELLTIRQYAAKSSVSKYSALLNAEDGLLRYTLQFCGATRTGRWAGRLFQPQNLPRPDKLYGEQPEKHLMEFLHGDFRFFWGEDSIIPYASSALRSMIKAPDGYRIVAADLAGIEARVLAWLADFTEKLVKFSSGADLYKILAAEQIFNKPIEEITDDERFSGKVGELACGYQGWTKAVCSMAKSGFGVIMPDAEGTRIASAWRKANQPIVDYWRALEDGFSRALRDRDPVDVGAVTFVKRGDFMLVKLPSGRSLHYYKPEFGGEGSLRFYGLNSTTKAWVRMGTYGGSLAENITQALSRDIMARGILRAEEAGFKVFLTVHDEVVALVPEDSPLNANRLCACMTILPQWAFGLPLSAEGFTAQRYRK